MQAIEVGIRELQRSTSRVIAEVGRGVHVLVAKQRKPVAVLVPVAAAASWVLRNRPPEVGSWENDQDSWLVEGLVRVRPSAEEAFDALNTQVRTRLVTKLSRLRRVVAAGRLVVREGQAWALVDLEVEDRLVTLVAVGRRVALERALAGGQPM